MELGCKKITLVAFFSKKHQLDTIPSWLISLLYLGQVNIGIPSKIFLLSLKHCSLYPRDSGAALAKIPAILLYQSSDLRNSLSIYCVRRASCQLKFSLDCLFANLASIANLVLLLSYIWLILPSHLQYSKISLPSQVTFITLTVWPVRQSVVG